MIIRKLFFILMIFFICSILSPGVKSEVQSLTDSEIIFIGVEEINGTTEIEIKNSVPFTYTIYRPADPYKIIVNLQDTDLGKFNEKMIFDRAGVLEIMPSMDESEPNIAKLEIALTVPADIEPVYSENSLILAFDNPDIEETAMDETMHEEMEEVSAEKEEIIEEEILTEAPETGEEAFEPPKYVGEKISIDFQDAELVHVFRLIADISDYNIVVSPDVKGKFSMRLADVPWDQALDVILRNYGLSKSVEGNIIRIAPTSVLAKEEEEIARAKESQEKSGNLETKVYPVNYADVDDIKKAINTAKILTKRGFISVDKRTSSVIIKDVEQKHKEYESLINALDEPTPQVSIDAKIVEVTTEFQKELGIQWGMLWEPPDTRTTLQGVLPLSQGIGFNSGNPLMVNLPAVEVGPGKGGSIGIGYINASGLFALDLQLSAMESTGEGKVISNPKVTTSDNGEARIMQGKKIPYQTVSQEGTQTEFMDAVLELTVTPHITPEGTIVLDLEAKKNEADFAGPQVLGVPTIDIKEIRTQVLIRNNDTLVIGGIFKNNAAKNLDAVPGFAEIPLIGRLFQHRKNVDKTDELLIFITPRIVEKL
jgi:type IV pilus assembly protein PilQ